MLAHRLRGLLHLTAYGSDAIHLQEIFIASGRSVSRCPSRTVRCSGRPDANVRYVRGHPSQRRDHTQPKQT
jgi:hypothetical protein